MSVCPSSGAGHEVLGILIVLLGPVAHLVVWIVMLVTPFLGPCPRLDLRLSLVDEPRSVTPFLVALDRGLHERCGLGVVRPTPTQPRWAALAGGEQKQAEADEE